MPCYTPISGYRSRHLNKSGKRSIVFDLKKGYIDMPVTVKCGQCIGCKLEYSRQWAIRCLHEAQLYDDNCFITLTYNSENLPKDGSLIKHHFQDFIKRLRKHNEPKKIRYFMCGEYGEKFARPHYHACLFNHDFTDKELWRSKQSIKLYISPTLQKLWNKGFSTIGTVNFDTAAYVARYILKKQTGDMAESHYLSRFSKENGLLSHPIQPEYTTMSRRPGIATKWFNQYKKEIYPDDFIVINGKKMPPPKFYQYLYELDENNDIKSVKKRRKTLSIRRKDDNTYDRLITREKIAKAKLKLKQRQLEDY
jgi:hypothetical protein